MSRVPTAVMFLGGLHHASPDIPRVASAHFTPRHSIQGGSPNSGAESYRPWTVMALRRLQISATWNDDEQ